MRRVIEGLLEEAADQFEAHEVVDTFIQSRLAGEGYLLSALDTDIARILAAREES